MPELNSATSDASTGSEATSTPAGEQAPAASESSTQETKALEVVHDGAPVPVEGEAVNDEQAAEETQEQPTGEAADKPEGEAEETESKDQPREEKKRGRDARIRDLVARERVYKDIIKNLNPDFDIDTAVKNGSSPETARMDAMEYNQARDQLTQSVAHVNADLQQQADDVGEKYSFMDTNRTDRTQQEKDDANAMMDLWFEAAKPTFVTDKEGHPIIDSNGDLVFESAAVPLFNFVDKIMTFVDARVNAASTAAENQGQRNAERKMAAVEVPTGRAPSTDKSGDDASLSAAEYAKKHGLKVV